MARKLHKSAHEIQNSMASRLPTNKNQAKSRIHVARMVIVFILGNKFTVLIMLTKYCDAISLIPFKFHQFINIFKTLLVL